LPRPPCAISATVRGPSTRRCAVCRRGDGSPPTPSLQANPKTRAGGGQDRTEPTPTGIDYLAALGDRHDAGLREQVSYRSLIDSQQEKEKKKGKEDREEEDGRG